ncbi:hypothetical protein EC09BKT24447_1942 [Escherichia coli 09BKT024447]|nr:hypothetical protein EC09BKT24447_1942 [Escherichia coli 09BKT024447]
MSNQVVFCSSLERSRKHLQKTGAKKAPPIAVTGGAFTRQRSFYRQDDES